MRAFAAKESIKRVRLGLDVPTFADVRNASLKLMQISLQNSSASPSEQLAAAQRTIEALETKIDEQSGELAYFDTEHKEAEGRAELAELNAASLNSRVDDLLGRLKSRGIDPDAELKIPTKWTDFIDWCDEKFAGRLVLNSAARRQVKKADFVYVEQAARCLRWLAVECRNRRIEGGDGSIREETVEDGIRNTHCGSDEYKTLWHGQRCDVEWHIKNGGNVRDPSRCLRIYYFWDSANQLIVVDEMPNHRRTDAT